MASHNTHMRILKGIEENEAILYLPKPCGHKEICNIWKHYDAMFKPVAYEEVQSNDHDKEHVDEHKRTNDQLVEDDKYYKKIFDTKKRGFHGRVFVTKSLLTQSIHLKEAYPFAILEAMNVPGLTHSHIASHLQGSYSYLVMMGMFHILYFQKYQEHQKSIKKPTLIPQKKRQVERYAYNKYEQLTPNNDYESILQSSNIQQPLTLNFIGMSYITINNIKAHCKELLHYLKIVTFGFAESCNIVIGLRNEVQMTRNIYESITGPLKDGETIAMTPMDFSEVVAPVDATSSMTMLNYSGTSIEKLASLYYGLGTGLQPLQGFALGGENYDLEMREISNVFRKTNSNCGRTSTSSNHNYLIHSQDFQGNNEILSPTFLHTPTDHNDFEVEENNRQAQTLPPFNSLGLVDGIERIVMESDMFVGETQSLLDMTVNLLDVLDDDLINGPW
uniref:Uncharacterized protein n=1 Tax=Lactuca sativa TaxID=4236 RepID=A0A9R1WVY9_LACSA|nr:hypothetical protein LSAT_V11C800405380 [Lactuca sativa]